MINDCYVIATMEDPVGWDRLRLILDVRDAREAGLIRWHDGCVQVRPSFPHELRARIDRHRDLLEHALTFDQEDNVNGRSPGDEPRRPEHEKETNKP